MGEQSGRRDWEELADADPLWAVLSDPSKRHGGWGRDEFFATGREEIETLMQAADSLGYPKGRASALDFGCGPGRLTRALDDRFDHVLGVDISTGMIDQAREMNADRPGCSFSVLSKDQGLADIEPRAFDLVYTGLVLQHMSGKREILAAIDDLVERTRDDGLLAFQLPVHLPLRRRLLLRRRLYRLLRLLRVPSNRLLRLEALNPMRMSSVPRREVEELLEARGMRVLDTAETRLGPDAATSLTFFATRAGST